MERGPTRDIRSFLSQSAIQLLLSNLVASLDLGFLVYKGAVGSEGVPERDDLTFCDLLQL